MQNPRIFDIKIIIRFKKRLLKHTKRLCLGLWLLRIFNRHGTIQVTDRCLKPAISVDVFIKILTLFGYKYIYAYTLFSPKSGLFHYSPDDLYCMLGGREITKKLFISYDPSTFASAIYTNRKLLFNKPLIDYEFVVAKEDQFFEHDIVKYTKMWLDELYPEYGKKRVEYSYDRI